METEALIYTLADTVIEAEADTHGDKLCNVEDDALIDTLPDMIPGVATETFGKKLCDVEAEALVHTVTYTQAEAGAEKLGVT